MIEPILEPSPRLKARIAGVFYAITIVTGIYGLIIAHGTHSGHAANLAASAAYLVVTLLLYDLLKPVSKNLSLLAAFFSIVGIASGDDGFFFFGFFCILVGYLIFRSTFFPRVLGALMAIAGLGLLTSVLAPLLLPPTIAHALSPYATAMDGVGEISLTVWLLVFGVNVPKWEARVRIGLGQVT
jgi:hypothetical protein